MIPSWNFKERWPIFGFVGPINPVIFSVQCFICFAGVWHSSFSWFSLQTRWPSLVPCFVFSALSFYALSLLSIDITLPQRTWEWDYFIKWSVRHVNAFDLLREVGPSQWWVPSQFQTNQTLPVTSTKFVIFSPTAGILPGVYWQKP